MRGGGGGCDGLGSAMKSEHGAIERNAEEKIVLSGRGRDVRTRTARAKLDAIDGMAGDDLQLEEIGAVRDAFARAEGQLPELHAFAFGG